MLLTLRRAMLAVDGLSLNVISQLSGKMWCNPFFSLARRFLEAEHSFG